MTEAAMVEPTPGVAHPRVHDRVEQPFTIVEPAFTMPWNERSRWDGMSVQHGVARAADRIRERHALIAPRAKVEKDAHGTEGYCGDEARNG